MNGPEAVVDLLEADRMLLERVGDEQQPLLQADGASVGDALDDEMPGLLDGRQSAITFGMSASGRHLAVAHTDRDDTIRIISARSVTSGERKIYEEG